MGCASQPEIDRSFYPGIISWGEHEILVHSSGNDLEFFDIDDPVEPAQILETDFRVGNLGDFDHDLLTWALCDDCRYGFAFFRLAAVIVDLGDEAYPSVQLSEKDFDLPQLARAFTFSNGDDQYLVAEDIESSCDSSGLFRILGPSFDSLEFLQCISEPASMDLFLEGGVKLQDDSLNDGEPYLWATRGYQVHVFKIVGSGSDLHLEHIRRINTMRAVARGSHMRGFGVDLAQRIAASVYSNGLRIWRVDDLENPALAAQLPEVDANTLSLARNLVWVGDAPYAGTSMTFDIENPDNPQPLDPGFWNQDLPWNDLPCLGSEFGGTFTRDGNFLFLSRWEVLQRFDVHHCHPAPLQLTVEAVPERPGVGEVVLFEIHGTSEVEEVTWSFGGPSCDGSPQITTCVPQFSDCLSTGFQYANPGPKTVSMIATVDDYEYLPVSLEIQVTPEGDCGPGGCTYEVLPEHTSVPLDGGELFAFSLLTQQQCPWLVDALPDWITVTSAQSGIGGGIVEFSVEPNSGPLRSADLVVGGMPHSIGQAGCSGRVGTWDGTMVKQTAVAGSFAFASAGNDLHVIDIRAPSAPVASLPTSGEGTGGLEVCGDLLLMAGLDGMVTVVDTSTPWDPVQRSYVYVGSPARDVVCRDGVAFVAASANGLYTIDISDPDNAEIMTFFDSTGQTTGVTFWEDRLLVADGTQGLFALDVSDPYLPLPVWQYPLQGDSTRVAAIGSHLFVVDRTEGIRVVSVESPDNPFVVAFVDIPNLNDVAATPRHLYATASYPGSLSILGIEDPQSPQMLTSFSTPNAASVSYGNGYAAVGRLLGMDLFLDCDGMIFEDGFRSGDVSGWSTCIP
jgi:hypothetical protein